MSRLVPAAPVIVLYALTNPQHLPWKAKGRYFPFKVSEDLKSRNEVIRFVDANLQTQAEERVLPEEIFKAAIAMLDGKDAPVMPEMIP